MRKTYIDNIKWITVVLVVIYHVIYIYNGVQTIGVIGPFRENQLQDLFQYLVYPWFMLLLFVVSGMSARFSLDHHSHKEFIRSRTSRYLVPSTLGLLVFWWILGYYNMAIGGAFDTMGAVPRPVLFLIMAASGVGVMWYLHVLWLLSILLVVVRKIEKDRLWKACKATPLPVIIALMIPVWGAAQVLNTPVIVVYRFGIYGLGFFLGYFIFSHDQVMDRMEKQWLLLTVAAILTGIAFTLVFKGENYADHSVLDTFLCNVYAWLGTIGFLAFMKKWGEFENPFTIFMKKEAWGLYLFHYLTLAIPAWYMSQYGKGLSPVICYLVTGVSAFAGAIALYEVIRRIPVVRWFACGIGGK